jgi:hypothetical protein
MTREPFDLNPIIVWHPRNWSSIMVSTTHQECLVYRRAERVDAAERIALRVSGQDHEWTETGREDFAGIDPARRRGVSRLTHSAIHGGAGGSSSGPPAPLSVLAGNACRDTQGS